MGALNPDEVGVDSIRYYSDRLATIGSGRRLDARVLTCGDWTVADLLWHLTEVQDFWTYIINNRPAGPDTYVQSARSSDEDLADGLRAATDSLVSALTGCAPTEGAWSWAADQTVAFTIRRQTHEALIHCFDGGLALNEPAPDVSPGLAADGVDEMIQIMLGAVPDWAKFERTSAMVQLVATDTNDTWTVAQGTMSGQSPTTGKQYTNEPCIEVGGNKKPDTVIKATAVNLDLWLWGRSPDETVRVTGDEKLAAKLREPIT